MDRPSPYTYASLNEVPAAWRSLRGTRLTVAQVNEIMAKAYELGYWQENAAGEPVCFVPDYGGARNLFAERHTVVDGLWIAGKESK
jgi:hypothetical protein